MIYFVCAMYCEAQPFIELLNLKKHPLGGRFQLFEGEDALCLITGTGAMNSAIAASGLLARQKPSSEDLIVNAGVCAGMRDTDPLGRLFLCSRITEQASGRHFYPDMLFAHPFFEDIVETVVHPLTFDGSHCSAQNTYSAPLVDMEASGFWQAASAYAAPHQIAVAKVISDHPNVPAPLPSAPEIQLLMEKAAADLIPWVRNTSRLLARPCDPLGAAETESLKTAGQRLKLSAAMQNSLQQSARYYALQGGNLCRTLQDFFTEHDVLCSSKREGKDYFELLRKRLL